ncbi:uncharacterized protein [Montipora foliosa]|uniref:uncharacterized protein n=1 Tax=Montipora foliosa TaxID=591990 RepID=UPI0035F13E7B
MTSTALLQVSKLNNRIKELEEKDLEDNLSTCVNACDVCEETDEEARERRISAELQKCSNQRETYVTSILEVPEVKQGQLKTPVKLDLFKTLNEHLTNQYIAALDMAPEICKCSKDLKREFYDLAYHGLRADHNELVHRVKDLEDTVQMGEEEKEVLREVKDLEDNRQRLIKELEEKWRALLSPPKRRPKTPWSVITRRGKRSTDSKKVKRNKDPGARPKKRSVRDERSQNPRHISRARKTFKRLRMTWERYITSG